MSRSDWVQQVKRVEKPWGHEEWFALVDGKFCGKAIHVPGESIHLTPGTRHRVTAVGDTVMLEASTTEVTDVVRLEDRYGRRGTSTG